MYDLHFLLPVSLYQQTSLPRPFRQDYRRKIPITPRRLFDRLFSDVIDD